MSQVESWRNERIQGHEFRGHISDHELALDPREVVARIKTELVASIVARLMEKLGPKMDEAIERAWRDE